MPRKITGCGVSSNPPARRQLQPRRTQSPGHAPGSARPRNPALVRRYLDYQQTPGAPSLTFFCRQGWEATALDSPVSAIVEDSKVPESQIRRIPPLNPTNGFKDPG